MVRAFLAGVLIAAAALAAPRPVPTAPAAAVHAPAGSCSAISGPLVLLAKVSRISGISPLLVFFDATATTDDSIPANHSAFEDLTYTWDFGDAGSSGTGTWAYGSNPGKNSMNAATGGVAAHLYRTAGSDSTYAATVTATDGVNTASCTLAATAYDPSGPRGFAGKATVCISAASKPVAGAGGCPAGAAVRHEASLPDALDLSLSGRRYLFKCGDTFTDVVNKVEGITWSIGAYGGCEATQTGRPIFSGARADGLISTIQLAMTAGDGRIADIDFESAAGFSNGAVGTGYNPPQIPYQITMWNLNSNGNKGGYAWNWGAQFGIIGSTQTKVNRGYIPTFINISENAPGGWTGNAFNNLDYQAIIGDYFDGPGDAGCTQAKSGLETVRISAGRLMPINNSTFLNANCTGAVLKIHNGNFGSASKWSGIYTEYVEISDNYYGGTSAAQQVENSPQGSPDDERLRYIAAERNLFAGPTCCQGGRQMLISGQNITVRNNVFYEAGTVSGYALYGAQFTSLATSFGFPSAFNSAYNNTCYAPDDIRGGQNCIGFAAMNGGAATSNSIAKNNLFYNPYGTGVTVANSGNGNTVSNNTAAVTANPAFANGSGKFSVLGDFKPTANYAGAAAVPVLNDALGAPWGSTRDLGAIHH